MEPRIPEPLPTKTFWSYAWKALRDAHRQRPASFYFLLAIPLVMLLALHMILFLDNPRRFALILSLMFIFFATVVFRALVDVFEISRKHLTEQRKLFRETLGEDKFIQKLGDRVGRGRKEW